MNESPLEQKAEAGDLGGAVKAHEMKIRQRLEMLREGHEVSYAGLHLKWMGEVKRETTIIQLQSPDGIITEVPVEMLDDEGWELVER
ncbi:MAG TPA: hypothetical protein VMU12_01920 [Candidatus Paceibacterota bacterium]|nr:hypothetical protein [Candidatus Paceibacterota bacterium]